MNSTSLVASSTGVWGMDEDVVASLNGTSANLIVGRALTVTQGGAAVAQVRLASPPLFFELGMHVVFLSQQCSMYRCAFRLSVVRVAVMADCVCV